MRTRRLPARYRDELPSLPIPIPVPPAAVEPYAPATDDMMDDDMPSTSSQIDWVQTEHDSFNLFRKYPHSFPTYDPENISYFDNLCDAPTFSHVDGGVDHERPWWAGFGSSLEAINRDYFAPFVNATTFRLMTWFYNSSLQKSMEDLNRLVDDVILADDFDREHLRDFNAS